MDHFETTRKLYTEVVQPITRYTRRRRIDVLLDYVSGKDVLDLGCAEHESAMSDKQEWWLHALIGERAKSVQGVDCDDEAVEELKVRGYNVCVADVEDMALGSVYDVVVAGELLEHLTNHRAFLESVKRHLAPGGVLVASMPNANSLNYFGQTLVFGHEVDAWDHTAFFTPVTFTVMLQKCGFLPVEIVLYQPDEIYHHTNRARRTAARVFNRLQQVVCFFRPALARGMIVVARPEKELVSE